MNQHDKREWAITLSTPQEGAMVPPAVFAACGSYNSLEETNFSIYYRILSGNPPTGAWSSVGLEHDTTTALWQAEITNLPANTTNLQVGIFQGTFPAPDNTNLKALASAAITVQPSGGPGTITIGAPVPPVPPVPPNQTPRNEHVEVSGSYLLSEGECILEVVLYGKNDSLDGYDGRILFHDFSTGNSGQNCDGELSIDRVHNKWRATFFHRADFQTVVARIRTGTGYNMHKDKNLTTVKQVASIIVAHKAN